jgi:hypothetical protein
VSSPLIMDCRSAYRLLCANGVRDFGSGTRLCNGRSSGFWMIKDVITS